MRRGLFAAAVGLAFAASAATGAVASRTPTTAPERAGTAQGITVYAAASLKDVLGALGAEYRRATGVPVKFSFAASSLLARQIEAGAPADAFVSADEQWMDYLAQRGAIDAASRRVVAGNRLVLVAPADSTIALKIGPRFPLVEALGRGRLAIAEPGSVPAGRYARSALQSLGAWDAVSTRLVSTEDVRGALALVARGEAPLGIVYATDAHMDRRVRVVDTFPAESHPPITYPAAAVTRASPAARGFVVFLAAPAARATLRQHGFAAPGS